MSRRWFVINTIVLAVSALLHIGLGTRCVMSRRWFVINTIVLAVSALLHIGLGLLFKSRFLVETGTFGLLYAAWLYPWQMLAGWLGEVKERKHAKRKMKHEMDDECVTLVNALNECPGIQTLGSCSGHGFEPFFITFWAESMESVLPISWALQEVRGKERKSNALSHGYQLRREGEWGLKLETSGLGDTGWYFVLEGPINTGHTAEEIAKRLREIMTEGTQTHINRALRYWEQRASAYRSNRHLLVAPPPIQEG